MDKTLKAHFDNIWSEDSALQNEGYSNVLAATDKPVDWAYEVWDRLLAGLTHKDNHVRAITAQVLSGLAKSDPQERILKDYDTLLAVTKDPRFVTARHTMQSLWKVGVAGKKQQAKYLEGMERRFRECISEKNCTMIRFDICVSMRNVCDVVKDEAIKEKSLALIETEEDVKYKKKYMGVWKKK
jgi:hypothetical protein